LDDHVSYRYPAADTVALSAMLWQVLRLRECLSASLPWLGLVEDFPEIEFARHYMTAEEIIRLYKCYVDEWDLFMEAVPIDEAWRLGRMVG
jgi:hypothetical protein